MRIDPRELAAIFAGGVLGAVARAELVAALPQHGTQWPWATFLVNVAGAFVLGLVVAGTPRPPAPPTRRVAFLGIGFCGALTTFSTMQLELLDMLDAGHLGLASGYAAVSVVAGLAAFSVATRLAGRPPVAT